MMWLIINFVLGGIITTQDLADYTAKIKTPLNITVRRTNGNFILFSPPPPFSGAIDLFILNVLKGRHVLLFTDASCCAGLYTDISPLDYIMYGMFIGHIMDYEKYAHDIHIFASNNTSLYIIQSSNVNTLS